MRMVIWSSSLLLIVLPRNVAADCTSTVCPPVGGDCRRNPVTVLPGSRVATVIVGPMVPLIVCGPGPDPSMLVASRSLPSLSTCDST